MKLFLASRDASVYKNPDTYKPKKWHVATIDDHGNFLAACNSTIFLSPHMLLYPQAVMDEFKCQRCKRYLGDDGRN